MSRAAPHMLKSLFVWLDAHPSLYWFVGFTITGAFALWLAFALRRELRRKPGRRTGLCFAIWVPVLLLAWRWPLLFQAAPFNPDESQLVAAALTYATDPIPFRSVDLTTSGPLNGLVLLPTHWLGVPQDYFNARLVGILLQWGMLLALYGALRRPGRETRTVFALLPGLTFLVSTADTDLSHYTSEHVSAFLFASACWLLCRELPDGTVPDLTPPWRWCLGGVVLGLLPWAKLQSIPIGATLALWLICLVSIDRRRSCINRLRWTLSLAAGALTPTALILALVVCFGQLGHSRTSYIEANLGYIGQGEPLGAVVAELARIARFTWQMPSFLATALGIVAAHAVWSIARWRRPPTPYWGAALLTAAAVYAVLAPHHAMFHYLLFLVAPVALWIGGILLDLQLNLSAPAARRALCATVIVAGGLLPLALRVRDGLPANYGRLAEDWRHPYGDTARHIRSVARPGDRLAMWGWRPHLFVETGLQQGVREAHTEHLIRDTPLRDTFFRPNYLAEIRSSRPMFFVDAVGPTAFGYQKREVDGHEIFPSLRDFIAANYVLVKDFGSERLYMLRDQAAARHSRLPRVVPLALDGFTEKSATGEVMRLGDAPPPPDSAHFYDDGRVFGDLIPHHPLDIFAHAPSRIVHPVPTGTLRLRGAGAIQPAAFADATNCTDGALFSVWWRTSDGVRTLAWQRHLDPVNTPADRIPAAFDLPVPAATAAVEFKIEPGPTPNRDWTYWHDLRFDIRYQP